MLSPFFKLLGDWIGRFIMRGTSNGCNNMKRRLFIQAGIATALLAGTPFFIAANAQITLATGLPVK